MDKKSNASQWVSFNLVAAYSELMVQKSLVVNLDLVGLSKFLEASKLVETRTLDAQMSGGGGDKIAISWPKALASPSFFRPL